MLVTLSGIVKIVRLLQYWKAKFPMLATGFPSYVEGTINFPEAFVSQLTMETVSSSTLYVKGSALTSVIPPNSNKTAAAKIEIGSFSLCL